MARPSLGIPYLLELGLPVGKPRVLHLELSACEVCAPSAARAAGAAASKPGKQEKPEKVKQEKPAAKPAAKQAAPVEEKPRRRPLVSVLCA